MKINWKCIIVSMLVLFIYGDNALADTNRILYQTEENYPPYRYILIIVLAILAIFVILRLYIKYLRGKIVKAKKELYKRFEWMKVTLSSIGEGIIVTDEKGIITYMNYIAMELTGYLEKEAIEKPVGSVLHLILDNTQDTVEITIEKVMNNGVRVSLGNNITLISKDGRKYSISETTAPMRGNEGNIIGIVIVFNDITCFKKAEIDLKKSYQELETIHEELTATEEELRQQYTEIQKSQQALQISEGRYRLAVEGANDGLWDFDFTTNKVFYSARCREMLGYSNDEIENDPLAWAKLLHPDDIKSYTRHLNNHIQGKIPIYNQEYRMRTKDGKYKWLSSRGAVILGEYGKPIRMAGSITDITSRKEAEEIIHNMAYYDSLTGLPNRTLFNDRVYVALSQARRSGDKVAILFLDLDNFKSVNDTLGHASGNGLLKQVAEILKGCLRESDTVARLGGDEFIFLLPRVNRMDGVIYAAERILEAFQKTVIIDGHEIFITTSIGISVFPDNGNDVQTLIKNADMAMYRAKETGKNNYKMFTQEMNNKIVKRLKMESNLRYAINEKEFTVNYQPQVEISTGKIVGMEALVRWFNASEGTLISPMDFIPVAEETGLIIPIGEYVMKTACNQNKMWQNLGYPPQRMVVNISSRQFQQSNLVDIIKGILDETGLEPKWFGIEITESTAMMDFECTINMLHKLRGMGISVSLDDFSTGYSSLSYLKKLPVNVLKIDKSFISDIAVDQEQEMIIKAVIELAHSMKLTVIAEGVETKEQYDYLKQQNCDIVQGYLITKPLPSNELETILKKSNIFKY